VTSLTNIIRTIKSWWTN